MIYHKLPEVGISTNHQSRIMWILSGMMLTSHHTWSVHGEMQHWLVILPGRFPLPRQEVQDQVPGDADHPVAPYHVVSRHYQVIAMGQVSEEIKEGSGRRTSVQRT